jgi:hypothetical protein
MSAPKTDIDKQEQQHKPALWGIRGAMIFAAALLLALITWLAYQGQEPGQPDAYIDGRTGAEVPVE